MPDERFLSVLDMEDFEGIKIKDASARSSIGVLSELKTTVKSSIVGAINSIDRVLYNVKAYGATGNGVTDDYQAFIDAIEATPIHGTLYIPMGLYRISEEIVITKPIRILGDYSGWDVYDANPDVTAQEMNKPLIISESNDYAINVKCIGFTIENVAVEMTSTSINLKGALSISNENSTVELFNRFNRIVNCSFIHKTSSYGAAVTCKYTGLTTIERCLTYGFAIGFWVTQLDDTHANNTSICLINNWAENYKATGYNIGKCYYGCLINCAADSNFANTNGYSLFRCFSTRLISCGSERNVNGFILDECFNCEISGCNSALSNCENAILLRYDGSVSITNFYATGDKSNPKYHDVYISTTNVHATFINTNVSSIYYADHEIGLSELPSGALLASTDSLVILT